MRKFLKIAAIGIVVLPLLAVAWLEYSSEQNKARATQGAIAALEPDAAVEIEFDDWLIMRPRGVDASTGIVVYPGAYCDIRGYAPVLRRIAAAGYFVVGLSMPFDFAIFAPNRAKQVIEAFPDIERWVLIGHSMGGAMAGRFVHLNPDTFDALMVWDSYPPASNSLVDASIPIMHIHRAKPDGSPPDKFVEMQYLFPRDSQWVPIPGGLHMYFGSFDGGSYEEEWEADIERAVQQDMIVAAALNWLRTI